MVEEKKENEEGAPKVVATTEDVPPAAVVKEAIAAEEAAIVVEEAVVPEVVAEVPIVETEPDTLPDDVPIEESLPVVDEEQGNVETPPQQEEDSSAGAGATTTTITNDPQLSGAQDFVAWFRSHGGIGKSIILWSNCSRLDFSDSLTAMIQSYINYSHSFFISRAVDDRITIGYEPGTNLRGLIATAPIQDGTILIHTPTSLVLSNADPDDKCELVATIKQQMSLESKSKWHPYFEFDENASTRLPMHWHRDGYILDELQGLPPTGDTHNHLDWYQEACLKFEQRSDESLSELDWRALTMYLTRSADIGLVPMYDLMNYHNGYINTRLQRDEEGGLMVVSLGNIPDGSPIYNSCTRGGWKSSDNVFNDYGFVEDYPQLWRWTDDEWHRLSHDDWDNAYSNNVDFEPNVAAYEVLVVSPTMAAISPSKQLVDIIGRGQRTLEEWSREIDAHHAMLRAPRARAIRAVAKVLDMMPTSIEEDERRLASMRDEVRAGTVRLDAEKEDLMKVVAYRLALKKALRLTVEVIDREWERFFVERREEL